MQYSNNQYDPDYPKRKRIFLLGVFGFVGFVIIISVVIVLLNNRNQVPSNEYLDPGSGETVSDPPGKEKESFGVTTQEPIYLGFTELLNNGVTKYQLDSIKIALTNYNSEREPKINEASVSVDTISYVIDDSEDSTTNNVTFTLTINRKDTYQASASLIGIREAQLTLNQSGKAVFKSRIIDSVEYNAPGD
jgi:hypothetical protein